MVEAAAAQPGSATGAKAKNRTVRLVLDPDSASLKEAKEALETNPRGRLSGLSHEEKQDALRGRSKTS